MFIIDGFMGGLAWISFFLLIGWGWRQFLRKNNPAAYRRWSARDAFVKKHGMRLGARAVKKWLK